MKSGLGKSVTVVMGQGWKYDMQDYFNELGGKILAQGYADCSTSWKIRVQFPKKMGGPRAIQSMLWKRWNGVWIKVS